MYVQMDGWMSGWMVWDSVLCGLVIAVVFVNVLLVNTALKALLELSCSCT